MTITLEFGSGNGHLYLHLGNRIYHFIRSHSLVVYYTVQSTGKYNITPWTYNTSHPLSIATFSCMCFRRINTEEDMSLVTPLITWNTIKSPGARKNDVDATHCFAGNSSFCHAHAFKSGHLLQPIANLSFVVWFICWNFIPSQILSSNIITWNFINHGFIVHVHLLGAS